MQIFSHFLWNSEFFFKSLLNPLFLKRGGKDEKRKKMDSLSRYHSFEMAGVMGKNPHPDKSGRPPEIPG